MTNTTQLTTRRAIVEERLRTGIARSNFYHRLARKIKERQLSLYIFDQSCCQLFYSEDLSRPFFNIVDSPADANMLLITNHLTAQSAVLAKQAYQQLSTPRMAVVIGNCALKADWSASGYDPEDLFPIDLKIANCPREHGAGSIYESIRAIWLQKVADYHTAIQPVSVKEPAK